MWLSDIGIIVYILNRYFSEDQRSFGEPLPSRYLEVCVTHVLVIYTGATSFDTVADSKNTIELIN